MADNCGHEAHSHDHEHDHDHDDDNAQLGHKDNLFNYIDRQNMVALNAVGSPADVVKPWHTRLEETKFLESDADDQMIIRIPFTGSVRLRSLLLKSGPAGQTPAKVSLFANGQTLDFDDISSQKPTQEFDVPQGREIGEYNLKTAKFSNISNVTLFIPASQGADTSRIYYIGFLGYWTEARTNPIITVYEAQANPADHKKIQGMDGTWHTPDH